MEGLFKGKAASATQDRPRKQQSIERDYFEMFRKSHPLPSGVVTYADKPDVIVNGTQKLGIEITNFYMVKGESRYSEQFSINGGKLLLPEVTPFTDRELVGTPSLRLASTRGTPFMT